MGGLESSALARKELCGVETHVRRDADVAEVGDELGWSVLPPRRTKGLLRNNRLDKPVSRVRMDLVGSVGLFIHEHVKRPLSPGYPQPVPKEKNKVGEELQL